MKVQRIHYSILNFKMTLFFKKNNNKLNFKMMIIIIKKITNQIKHNKVINKMILAKNKL